MVEVMALRRVSSLVLDFVTARVELLASALDVDPRALRIVIAETREELDGFMKEVLGRGFSAQPSSSIFHIYALGKPTILVVASELYEKGELLAEGELLVSLAHAKLHGSQEHYLLRYPGFVRELLDLGASRELVETSLYLVASGVKGYEATELVVEKGFLKEMEELYKHHLKVTPEEMALWSHAREDLRVQALLSLNAFKALSSSLPVYARSSSGRLRGLFEQNLDLIPPDLKGSVEKALFEILPRDFKSTAERLEACLKALSDIICMAST